MIRLLKANKHLNEEAAKTLLERALETKSDGTLDFTRDYMWRASVKLKLKQKSST
jgi:hypothetical protein